MGADVDILLSRGAFVPLVAMIAGIDGRIDGQEVDCAGQGGERCKGCGLKSGKRMAVEVPKTVEQAKRSLNISKAFRLRHRCIFCALK